LDFSGQQIEIGFRWHVPYVELKVWFPAGVDIEKHPVYLRIEDEVKDWVVSRDGRDIAKDLCQHVAAISSAEIIDAVSGGVLAHRVGQSWDADEIKTILHIKQSFEPVKDLDVFVEDAEIPSLVGLDAVRMVLAGDASTGTAICTLNDGNNFYTKNLQTAFSGHRHRVRNRQILVEWALRCWSEWLA